MLSEFGGRLPRDPVLLRELCGVGDYTAGAIASIAFGRPVPAVDGNVIRVISRLYGIRENAALPQTHREIAQRAAALLPEDRPGDLNQALMDLGATVCVPGTPDCGSCPLRGLCACGGPDAASELPVLPARKPPRELRYRVWLLERDGRLLVHQRTERMLEGLWVFPMTPLEDALPRRVAGVPFRDARELGQARHVFTHQVWQMTVMAAEAGSDAAPPDRFVFPRELSALAMPTAMRGPLTMARMLREEGAGPHA